MNLLKRMLGFFFAANIFLAIVVGLAVAWAHSAVLGAYASLFVGVFGMLFVDL